MSQTPSQLRKVPVHILDDLSSKFLINLVSLLRLCKFVFLAFFFLPVFVFVSSSRIMTHSLKQRNPISSDCSFKLNSRIGSS